MQKITVIVILFFTYAHSDKLLLKDGETANVIVEDTTGCSVRYIKNGNDISLNKQMINMLIIGNDTIDLSSYVCSEKSHSKENKSVKSEIDIEDTPNHYSQSAAIPKIRDTLKEFQIKKDLKNLHTTALIGNIFHFSSYGSYLSGAFLFFVAGQKWVKPYVGPIFCVLYGTGPIISCLAERSARNSYPDLFPSNTKTGLQYYGKSWIYFGSMLASFGVGAICMNNHLTIPGYLFFGGATVCSIGSFITAGTSCVASYKNIKKMEYNQERRLNFSLSPIIGNKIIGLCLNIN